MPNKSNSDTERLYVERQIKDMTPEEIEDWLKQQEQAFKDRRKAALKMRDDRKKEMSVKHFVSLGEEYEKKLNDGFVLIQKDELDRKEHEWQQKEHEYNALIEFVNKTRQYQNGQTFTHADALKREYPDLFG